ncbi:MAG: membrane protein [Hyphococcus sp.]|nr:MAG: membrane protein [Marinicaulis sp.]
MSAREVTILILMCLVWGFHFVVIKTAVTQLPPIFYAAVRMTLVAALMAPFLRWRKGQMARIFGGGICLGVLNYSLMFTGLKFATASTSAIAMELYVPFATILSFLFLGDKFGLQRSLGIALAFAGVAVIALAGSDEVGPETRLKLGIGLVAAGAFVEAVGAVFVKQSVSFKPHELMAWFGVIGAIGLWIMTAVFESGQQEAFAASNKTQMIGAILYSAVGASIFGHTAYYWLIKRLPVSLVAPSVLLTTVIAVFSGVFLLGDPFGVPMIIGGLMTLAGVGVVLLRTAKKQDIKAPLNESGITP